MPGRACRSEHLKRELKALKRDAARFERGSELLGQEFKALKRRSKVLKQDFAELARRTEALNRLVEAWNRRS